MTSVKDIAETEKSLAQIILEDDATISAEAVHAVERAAVAWRRNKGEAIVRQDEVCDRWVFVSKGLCRILYTKRNNTSTLFFDGGGAIFTSFHALLAGEKGIFGVEALTDSHGWEISHDKYKELTRQYPDLLRFELAFLHKQLYCLEDRYARFAMSTAEERYKRFWRQWSNIHTRTTREMIKYLPLKIIAEYLSITQQTLSMLRRKELEQLRSKKRDADKK